MKTLFKKVVRKAFKVVLEHTKNKNPEFLLKKYINLHNKSYEEISRIVLALNNGLHPKHHLINYRRFFLENVNLSDSILDLGCGNGFLAYELAGKARQVTAVDIVPANIESASRNYQRENLKFVTADATQYCFDQKIDKIILSNVLEHIESRSDFLNKLHQISDTLLLRVPLITRDWLAFYKRENGFEYRLDKTHFIEYTPEELKQELAIANWKIEKYQINWGEFWGVVKKLLISNV